MERSSRSKWQKALSFGIRSGEIIAGTRLEEPKPAKKCHRGDNNGPRVYYLSGGGAAGGTPVRKGWTFSANGIGIDAAPGNGVRELRLVPLARLDAPGTVAILLRAAWLRPN